MTSLYAQYMKEREDFDIIEDERGFATYQIKDNECYIRDIFVLPEFRKTKLASEYANKITEIAKDRGCKFLTGTVAPNANGSTESCAVLIAYGFKLFESRNDRIIFIKEIA